MQWFNSEPEISRREMTPVEENWNCPTVGCCGVMVATGERWATSTPGYFHKCTACGFAAALRGEKYPRIIYVSK